MIWGQEAPGSFVFCPLTACGMGDCSATESSHSSPWLWVLLQFPFPFPFSYSFHCKSRSHFAYRGGKALGAWQSHPRAGLAYSFSFLRLPLFLPSCLPLAFPAPPENKPGSKFWFNKTKQGILGLILGWPFTVL